MNALWETQIRINEENNKQFGMLNKQIELLISIIEDHEADMVKMAEHINNLEKEISELKTRA